MPSKYASEILKYLISIARKRIKMYLLDIWKKEHEN